MELKPVKKPRASDKPTEFSFSAMDQRNDQFGLENQKASLLKYNENIRTAKDIRFAENGRLQIPVFANDPDVCEIGEIALIGGTMKYCSAANTWSDI